MAKGIFHERTWNMVLCVRVWNFALKILKQTNWNVLTELSYLQSYTVMEKPNTVRDLGREKDYLPPFFCHPLLTWVGEINYFSKVTTTIPWYIPIFVSNIKAVLYLTYLGDTLQIRLFQKFYLGFCLIYFTYSNTKISVSPINYSKKWCQAM